MSEVQEESIYCRQGSFTYLQNRMQNRYKIKRIKTENAQDSTSQEIFDLEKLVFYSY